MVQYILCVAVGGCVPQGNISRRRHIAYGVYIANSQNLYRRVRSRWFLCCRETARRVEGLTAARSFGGSDDALCRHSLPPQSPRPTTAAVCFYGFGCLPCIKGGGPRSGGGIVFPPQVPSLSQSDDFIRRKADFITQVISSRRDFTAATPPRPNIGLRSLLKLYHLN